MVVVALAVVVVVCYTLGISKAQGGPTVPHISSGRGSGLWSATCDLLSLGTSESVVGKESEGETINSLLQENIERKLRMVGGGS